MSAGIEIVSEADGPAVTLENAQARGDVLLVCEHASNRLPAALGTLGLPASALASHIAWDPGALGVARRLSDRLDATLVAPGFSRLVYDCNRPPQAADAIPEVSEATPIPGNQDLDAAHKAARVAQVYRPFHDAIARLVRARLTAGRPPVLVTVHSFTPVYLGRPRTVELGIVHDADSRLADACLSSAAPGDPVLRRNAPYGPADGVTHTLRTHALAHGLLNVMIEIRNDLLAGETAQAAMADTLAGLLQRARAALAQAEKESAG